MVHLKILKFLGILGLVELSAIIPICFIDAALYGAIPVDFVNAARTELFMFNCGLLAGGLLLALMLEERPLWR